MATPAKRTAPESAPADFVLDDLDLAGPPQDGLSAAAGADSGPDRQHRRRRRAAPPQVAGPRPTLLTATDPILRWGPPALLAFAPLAWGSVEAWSRMVVVAGAAAIGAVWLLRLSLLPERCDADRSAGSHAAGWSAGLRAPLAVLGCVCALQLAPLGWLVGALSPVGAQLQRQAGIGAGSLTLALAWQESLHAISQLVAMTLLFFAVLDGVHGRAEVRRLAAVFVALGFGHAVGGILWHYQSTGEAYWRPAVNATSFGPYINRNHFACLMGMAVPVGVGVLLSLGHRRRGAAAATASPAPGLSVPAAPARAERGMQRLLFGFVIAVMAGALALSLSRGGIVSTLAALSALAAAVGARRQIRGHAWTVAAAVAGALAFAVWLAAGPLMRRLGTLAGLFEGGGALAPRAGIWSDTLRMAADFPLFGTGFGTFAEAYPRYQTAHLGNRVLHAHNDWLQLLAEGGLAGALAVLLLLGAYFAVLAKLLGRRRDREAVFLALGGCAGLLAFLLHAFSEFNARIPANALWFTVLAAFTLKAVASTRETSP